MAFALGSESDGVRHAERAVPKRKTGKSKLADFIYCSVPSRSFVSMMRVLSAMVVMVTSLLGGKAYSAEFPSPFSRTEPGQYPLETPWLGEVRTTFRIGFYAKYEGPADPKETGKIRFDLLTVTDGRSYSIMGTNASVPLPRGSLIVSERVESTTNGWQHKNLHRYRAALPGGTK